MSSLAMWSSITKLPDPRSSYGMWPQSALLWVRVEKTPERDAYVTLGYCVWVRIPKATYPDGRLVMNWDEERPTWMDDHHRPVPASHWYPLVPPQFFGWCSVEADPTVPPGVLLFK